MSTIEFVTTGVLGEGFRDYDFDQPGVLEISKDEDKSSSDSQWIQNQSLSERIVEIHEGNHTTHVIDKVIRVRTLSKEQIAPKVDFWSSKRIATGVAAAACLVVSGKFIPALLIAIPLFYRTFQAHRQINLWTQNHSEEIANKRSSAFEKGFAHIMAVDTKNPVDHLTSIYKMGKTDASYTSVLTSNELRNLYQQYFESFTHENSSLSLMKEAIHHSPF